jgi:chromosomal replication initiation ATPase DnaA
MSPTKVETINRIIENAQNEILISTGIKVILTKKYKDVSKYEALEELYNKICKEWHVTTEWIRERSRSKNRPIMRKILWLAAREQFPEISMQSMAFLTGVTDHGGVVKGLRHLEDWIIIKDELALKYYDPVKHLVHKSPANYLLNPYDDEVGV